MTRTPPDILFSPLEGLSWRPFLERWVCSRCAISVHRQCDAYGCECACHDDPWLPRKSSMFTRRLRYGIGNQSNRKPERTKPVRIIRYTPQTQFELASEGVHRARLEQIKDLDPALNSKGEEHQRIRFIWSLEDQVNSSNYAFRVFQTFNLSLHPQSFLSRAIFDITGREPGREFDLDSLVGVEVELVIKHNSGDDGRVYANVRTILRAPDRGRSGRGEARSNGHREGEG
jgi:hypothetical protein